MDATLTMAQPQTQTQTQPLPMPMPTTPAAYVACQEWWNLMYAADAETVRFVDGDADYQSPGESRELEEIF